MNIHDIANSLGISFEDLADRTGISESTLSDIMSGRSDLSRCTAKTLRKLANGLEVSMERLLDLESFAHDLPEPVFDPVHELDDPDSFMLFRGAILHYLDSMGEKNFINLIMESRMIDDMYDHECYAEALYLLGLLDYLCDKNGLLRYTCYNAYRGETMEEPVFAQSARVNPMVDYACFSKVIPQILKFNFIETPDTLKLYR